MSRAALQALLLALLLAAPLSADDAVPQRPRRMLVLPVFDHAPDPQRLFRGLEEPEPDSAGVHKGFSKLLLSSLRHEPRVELLELDVARERIRRSHSAKDIVDSAREDFERLNIEGAIGRIEGALISLRLSYADLFERSDMSDLYETLALCYSERPRDDAPSPASAAADSGRVRDLLKTMFYYAPRKSFASGFYGPAFESAIREAFHDYRSTYPKENPLGDQRRLEQFMADLGVDTLVHAWVEEGTGADRLLRVQIYDRSLATVTFVTQVDPPGAREGRRRLNDEARLERFISQWLACLPGVDLPGGRPTGPKQRFFIDTGFAYSIYGKDTTREPFHNLGMGLSLEYQFLAGLGTFLQVNMFTSTQDSPRDLLDSFTSVRTAFGLSYAFRGSWWRLSARFGFDVHVLGSYKTTTDPWCKWAGTADERCQDPDLTDLGNEVTMGFYGGLAAQFFATENFYVNLRLSTASYVVPLDQSIAVNFPVTTEVSLGYGF